MKTVPPELYEAATVDGAGGLQKFRYVTLPSLRGILLINLVLITIATLNTFDMVLPLTGGGPGRATEVIALYIYHLVFSEFQFGRGAAVAVVLMVIGLVLSACYARMLRRERVGVTDQEQREGGKEERHKGHKEGGEILPLPLREGVERGGWWPTAPSPNPLPQGGGEFLPASAASPASAVSAASAASSASFPSHLSLRPSPRFRRRAGSAAIYAGYIIIGLVFLFPLLWVASLSLRPMAELFAFPPRLVPQHPTLAAYRDVLTASPLARYLLNSVKLVSATVLCALAIAVPSAYALSRLRFRRPVLKSLVMLGMLAVQLISPLVTALPLYRWFSALGLINSHAAVVLVYVALSAPLATWMLTGFPRHGSAGTG